MRSLNKYILIILISVSYKLYSQDSIPCLINSEYVKSKNLSNTEVMYILQIDSTMKALQENYRFRSHEHFQTHSNFDNFNFDYIPTLNFLKQIVYGNYGITVKQFAAFKVSDFMLTSFSFIKTDPTFANDCIKFIKADDIIWSVNPEAVLYFNNLNTNLALLDYAKSINKPTGEWSKEEKDKRQQFMIDKYLSYGNELYHKNPDRKVKAYALIYMIEMLHPLNRKDIASEYYYRLSSEFSDLGDVKSTLVEYNPSGRLIPGKPVPAFEGRLLKSKSLITSEMLKGQYYLIYFWATWCGSCIVKMERLNQVYNKYKDSGFTIVAFSLDNTDKVVNKFQSEKWEMPWFNIRLEDGFEDEVAKEFELNSSVPKMLLIDPNGIIVEDNSTIGDDIDSTISKYLSQHK